jgi:hypothetical protein
VETFRVNNRTFQTEDFFVIQKDMDFDICALGISTFVPLTPLYVLQVFVPLFCGLQGFVDPDYRVPVYCYTAHPAL